jgi:hypothetical protein
MASKTFLASVLLVSLLFCNCKKEDKPKEENDPPPVVTLPSFNNVNGMIQALYAINESGNNTMIDSSVAIGFYESPSKTTTFVDAGNVSVNSVSLTFSSFSGYQNFGPEKVNLHNTLNWSVSGSSSSTVAPFTYSDLPVMPKYTGYGALPDTCVKSSGVSLNISGISNFNTATAILMQDSQSKFKVIAGNGTVTFSAQDLAAFNTTTPAQLMITVSNLNTIKINNVPYNRLYSTVFNKVIVLK